MNKLIKSILGDNPKEDAENKLEQLKKLERDIELARKVLDNSWLYCEECDDYYLAPSFMMKVRDEMINECVYVDPINSGGNEYKKMKYSCTYATCPKGHEFLYEKSKIYPSIYDD